ncbi:hypothetical protein HYH02_014538 [Chlamydomonas schloesseri]|uniref:CRAL-TRIO domain-containing protein n=1 Tax=Chlamydomonas schloesseri TaxID=2026947 RepID=A0A835VSK5_9CHLO|nr:hypothetical protein HYH02_014538 [Chlamydomonas schloesseri]|eukprot:KAG2427707.1 hypothetical protein HYH02_014538 [Chlamydomonas schloesseri]
MWGAGWGWGAATTAAPAATTAADNYTEADAYWYLNPTDEQKTALGKLRETLTAEDALVPDHDDDITLLRFLMARDFNVDKALAMYRDMRTWRASEAVNGLYQADPAGSQFPEMEALLEVYPHFTYNTDKFGRPVYIEMLGRTDATRLFEVISVERLIRYHCWTWERYLRCYLPACSQAAGRPICTTTVIIDLAGLGLGHFNAATQRLLNTFSKIDQDYYPEHLGLMFIINTPLIFRGMWAAVQPLLQERTRKKIIMLGSDYLPELAKVVPLEALPQCLGGRGRLQPGYKSVGPWRAPDPAQAREEEQVVAEEGAEQAAAAPEEESGEQQQQQQQQRGAQQLQEAPQVGQEGVVVSISTGGGDLLGGAAEGEGSKGKVAVAEAAGAAAGQLGEPAAGKATGDVAAAAVAALTVQA